MIWQKESSQIPTTFAIAALLICLLVFGFSQSGQQKQNQETEFSFSIPFDGFTIELEKFDKKSYLICKTLENHRLFTRKGARFFVLNYPSSMPAYDFYRIFQALTLPLPGGGIKNEIYIWPDTIKSEFFEEIIAHEMGHIEYQTGDDFAADSFASKIVGKERIIKALKSKGAPTLHPRIMAILNLP